MTHKLVAKLQDVTVAIEIDADSPEAAAAEVAKLDVTDIIEDGDVTGGTVADVVIVDE